MLGYPSAVTNMCVLFGITVIYVKSPDSFVFTSNGGFVACDMWPIPWTSLVGVETVIEAMDDNDELFLYESADLLFHYLMLLQAKGFTLKDIENELKGRHK